MSTLAIALTGNPNTGKSTIFNQLTGARQKIGNWPGVTVDKKVGYLNYKDRAISVVDLPGTYSINARSPEEEIVIDFLMNNKMDVVVDVVDSSNIERNLFLTVQLLEKGIHLLVDLNMQDEAKRRGMNVDARKLEDFFRFDQVLLDAPCSGSGTMLACDARTTRAFSEKLVRNSAATQLQMLKKALTMLKSGGTMVYSTCSILEMENENVVKAALKGVKAVIEPIQIPDLPLLPASLPGAICVCPTDSYEGFFMAKIRKE